MSIKLQDAVLQNPPFTSSTVVSNSKKLTLPTEEVHPQFNGLIDTNYSQLLVNKQRKFV